MNERDDCNLREKPKPFRALMFSGGMDSYLAHRLYRPDFLVFCAAGHRYERRESQAIERLGLKGAVAVDRTLDLSRWERADAIVPLRNLFFAMVGVRYADTVWLGSLKGEGSWDKCPEFYWAASTALSQCYRADRYWCDGRRVEVSSPVAGFTKASLLRAALAAGVTREEVSLTVSCYEPGGFCGRCQSCFKRAVATALNGWTEKYAEDPFRSPQADACRAKVAEGYYTGDRLAELKEVLK